MTMSIIYACNKKKLRAAARAYKHTVPFDMDKWYSETERWMLEHDHEEWINDCEWLMGETSLEWFIPHCAWCREERGEENDYEHVVCDTRLYYCSEQGVAEQKVVLSKQVMPTAPAVVIANIMSFLTG